MKTLPLPRVFNKPHTYLLLIPDVPGGVEISREGYLKILNARPPYDMETVGGKTLIQIHPR